MTHVHVDHDWPLVKGMERLVLCQGLRGDGKQGEWVELWKMMQNSTDATFRSNAINALSCSDNQVSLKSFLESMLGDGNSVNYSRTERLLIFSAILSNSRSGMQPILNFIENFDLDINRRLGSQTVADFLTSIAREIKNDAHKTLFTDIIKGSGVNGTFEQSLMEIIDGNFDKQKSAENVLIMNEIGKFLLTVEETTVTPTDQPTTTSTQSTTLIGTTSISSSTSTTVSTTTTTASSSTSQSPTTTQSTTTTTGGAMNVNVNFLVILFSMILVVKRLV
jgi:hypothetical protein